jgi:hypothetical protein
MIGPTQSLSRSGVACCKSDPVPGTCGKLQDAGCRFRCSARAPNRVVSMVRVSRIPASGARLIAARLLETRRSFSIRGSPMFSGEKYLEVDREPAEDGRAITDGFLLIGTQTRYGCLREEILAM